MGFPLFKKKSIEDLKAEREKQGEMLRKETQKEQARKTKVENRESVQRDIANIKAARKKQKWAFLREKNKKIASGAQKVGRFAKGTASVVKESINFVDDVLPNAPKGKKGSNKKSKRGGGGSDEVFGGMGINIMGNGDTIGGMMASRSKKRKREMWDNW